MKGLVLAAVATFALTGCGPGKFAVKHADTSFSKNKNPTYIAENNRISTKSIAGGFHIDDKGVFINPFVSKDIPSGKIVLLGFSILNKTSFDTGPMGSVNQLGLIREVVFRLPDGKIVTLRVKNQEYQAGIILYDTVSRRAGHDVWESGTAIISKTDFAKLASANRISARVLGSRQSMVYEEGDISPEFLVNLKQFYDTYVK